MTINEAIKILQYQGPPEHGPTIRAFVEAKKLSIEALKTILLYRYPFPKQMWKLLPGETKE